MKSFLVALLVAICTTLSANISADSSKIHQLQMIIENIDAVEDHCEVPCGIYGDSLRIALIDEHIRTIEKATHQIIELSSAEKPNYNQLVRWINNKEKHAEEIQHIVSQYFLHQRIKIVDASNMEASKKYTSLLTHLHHILVYTMKTKQGLDLENLTNLKNAVESFESAYFHKH